ISLSAFYIFLLFLLHCYSHIFFLYLSGYHLDLHSFPTRRSSDLITITSSLTDLATSTISFISDIVRDFLQEYPLDLCINTILVLSFIFVLIPSKSTSPFSKKST